MAFSFATNADFLTRYDWRWVSQNVVDTNPPTAATLAELQGGTGGGAVLATLLADASELVLSACAVGARYTQQDLNLYGGNLLIKITCQLALGPLLDRRVRATPETARFVAAFEEGQQYLEQLRRGDRVFFNVPEVPQAGLPGTQSMAPVAGINPPLISNAVRYFGWLGPQTQNYYGAAWR